MNHFQFSDHLNHKHVCIFCVLSTWDHLRIWQMVRSIRVVLYRRFLMLQSHGLIVPWMILLMYSCVFSLFHHFIRSLCCSGNYSTSSLFTSYSCCTEQLSQWTAQSIYPKPFVQTQSISIFLNHVRWRWLRVTIFKMGDVYPCGWTSDFQHILICLLLPLGYSCMLNDNWMCAPTFCSFFLVIHFHSK